MSNLNLNKASIEVLKGYYVLGFNVEPPSIFNKADIIERIEMYYGIDGHTLFAQSSNNNNNTKIPANNSSLYFGDLIEKEELKKEDNNHSLNHKDDIEMVQMGDMSSKITSNYNKKSINNIDGELEIQFPNIKQTNEFAEIDKDILDLIGNTIEDDISSISSKYTPWFENVSSKYMDSRYAIQSLANNSPVWNMVDNWWYPPGPQIIVNKPQCIKILQINIGNMFLACESGLAEWLKTPEIEEHDMIIISHTKGNFKYWNDSDIIDHKTWPNIFVYEPSTTKEQYQCGLVFMSKYRALKIKAGTPSRFYDEEARCLVVENDDFILMLAYEPEIGTEYTFINDNLWKKWYDELNKYVHWMGRTWGKPIIIAGDWGLKKSSMQDNFDYIQGQRYDVWCEELNFEPAWLQDGFTFNVHKAKKFGPKRVSSQESAEFFYSNCSNDGHTFILHKWLKCNVKEYKALATNNSFLGKNHKPISMSIWCHFQDDRKRPRHFFKSFCYPLVEKYNLDDLSPKY